MKAPIASALVALLAFAAGSAFSATLSEKQQTAIRQEVTQVMQDYLATSEHLDCAGVLRFHADVPEFRYADIDGKQYDYAASTKNTTDLFAGLSALKCTLRSQDILVLGRDTALAIWHGAVDLIQKDGSVLRANPYNAAFLFRRFGGTWKIVYQHESGLPPQPAKPAEAPAGAKAEVSGP